MKKKVSVHTSLTPSIERYEISGKEKMATFDWGEYLRHTSLRVDEKGGSIRPFGTAGC